MALETPQAMLQPTTPTTIEARLEEMRRRLLDLTRRNRLLNHRPKGRSTLRIVDEMPDQIYRLLVAEGQKLEFLSREEAPVEVAAIVREAARQDEEPGEAGSAAAEQDRLFTLAPLESGSATAARHTDHHLQTALTGSQLQTRLIHLAREANSAREEQGANTLYLVLGIVEWRERDRTQVSRAPLLFIPVDLQRRSVNTRHALSRFDEEPSVNPNLREMCQRLFQLELPAAEVDENLDVAAYFDTVAKAISALPGWRLLPEIHLGLFSFAKLLMYRDLDPGNWPPGKLLSQHPLVRQLFGFQTDAPEPPDGMPAASTLDEVVRPLECYQVLDADSSQQVAILAAKRGLSMVIEGPPGTGKSQTITNIIAECLAAKKSVLFVAEKAAALTVVQRRLEAAGLGDYALELHSNKANKRLVLDQVQRALASAEVAIAVDAVDPSSLETTRSKLNAYAREIHQPLGELGISLFAAIGRALSLQDAPEARIAIPEPFAWSRARLDEALAHLEDYDRWLMRVGAPEHHPWRGVGLTTFDTLTRQRLLQAIDGLEAGLQALRDAGARLAAALQVPRPATIPAAREMLAAGRALAALPVVDGARMDDDAWDRQAAERDAWLRRGIERAALKARWSKLAKPEAEKQSWAPILERRGQHSAGLLYTAIPAGMRDSVHRIFSQTWRNDADVLAQFLLPNVQLDADQQTELVKTLLESARLRAEVLAGVPRYADAFGRAWQNIDGDWDGLVRVAGAISAARALVARKAVAQASAAAILAASDRSTLTQALQDVEAALAQLPQLWESWCAALSSDGRVWLDGTLDDTPPRDLQRRVAAARGSIEQIEDWVQYQAARAVCERGALRPVLDWATSPAGAASHGQLARCFARQFYRQWIDEALRKMALTGFRGEDHQALIERFRSADLSWIQISRRRVVAGLRGRIPDLNHEAHRQSRLGILKAEIRKKRRHLPLRRLLASAGEVIQTIKPCFMMSPISIAQYLTPGGLEFDVVIFDEASQVEPADAFGAIARGRQVILVGDEKQLPPTNFFTRIETGDEPADDEEFSGGDLESILSLGVVRLRHQCTLRWHYRSRHAGLIEFSNRKFYDGGLRVFPGPYTASSEYGLQFRYVPDGVYMRGAGQHNPTEARQVAQEVLRHAVEEPGLSLGVGAFSMAQQRAIEDEVEQLRRTSRDPRVEAFFSAQSLEPFFVKNLETIQGDERDVILLSVGYGPDEQGRVTMNFGPLNREGGWRRLNVLVTRARQRCVLFSSLRADQMNLGTTQARGVVALKEYLHLAEHGAFIGAPLQHEGFDSPFEADVCRALRERGWEVHTQIGSGGFFIDLAVVDPDRPGRYLLGIECDGATYHSSPTARDRDRLRQQVLEDLGWSIARIWSTDWFRRPETTLRQLLDRLEQLRPGRGALEAAAAAPETPESIDPPPEAAAAAPETSESVDPPPAEPAATEALPLEQPPEPEAPPAPEAPAEPPQPRRGRVIPYALAPLRSQKTDHAIAVRSLIIEIGELVAAEAPIHIDEAQRVIASYYFTRAAKTFQWMFGDALRIAERERRVVRRGAFLWGPGMDSPPVRSRDGDCPVTKAELIAPEEMREAVLATLELEFGVRQADIASTTARLLGFKRRGSALELAITEATAALIDGGAIAVDSEGYLSLST